LPGHLAGRGLLALLLGLAYQFQEDLHDLVGDLGLACAQERRQERGLARGRVATHLGGRFRSGSIAEGAHDPLGHAREDLGVVQVELAERRELVGLRQEGLPAGLAGRRFQPVKQRRPGVRRLQALRRSLKGFGLDATSHHRVEFLEEAAPGRDDQPSEFTLARKLQAHFPKPANRGSYQLSPGPMPGHLLLKPLLKREAVTGLEGSAAEILASHGQVLVP
jgi:hypothetical protein